MTVVTGLSMLMLGYASYKFRLVNKNMPISMVKYFLLRQVTSIIVFLLSIPLAFYKLGWEKYFLFVLFPFQWIMRGYFRKYAEKKSESPESQ
jgi:hypothetical protein